MISRGPWRMAGATARSGMGRARTDMGRVPRMRGTRLLALGASVTITAVFATAGSAMAAKIYVSPTGEIAAKRGSCAKPNWHTIQSAVNAALDGDTVIVCSGTYPE